MRLFLASVVTLVAALAGCYSPSYRDCAVTCPDGMTCPSGYECKSGMCRLPEKEGPCDPGPGADGGSDAQVTRLPVDMLGEANTNAICGYYVRCQVFASLDDCLSVFWSPGLRAQFDDIAAAVLASKIQYDEQGALACIAAFSTLACTRDVASDFRNAAPECLRYLTGTLAASATCAIDSECISGVCMKQTNCPSTACCMGTCVGNTPPGDRALTAPCTRADRCIDGYCDPTGFCMPLRDAGATCSTDFECKDNLYCGVGNGQTECKPYSTTTCMIDKDCADLSTVCSSGQCTTGGLGGFSCTGFSPGDGCQEAYYCNNSMCTLAPGPGEFCGATNPNEVCRDDSFCFNGQCTARYPNSVPCEPAQMSNSCSSGFCDTNGRCAPRPACI